MTQEELFRYAQETSNWSKSVLKAINAKLGDELRMNDSVVPIAESAKIEIMNVHDAVIEGLAQNQPTPESVAQALEQE